MVLRVKTDHHAGERAAAQAPQWLHHIWLYQSKRCLLSLVLQLTACPVQLGTPFGTAAMPEVRAADVVSVDDAGLPVCLWPLECSHGLMCGASSSSVASPFCYRRMASHSSLTRSVHQNITSLIHARGSQLKRVRINGQGRYTATTHRTRHRSWGQVLDHTSKGNTLSTPENSVLLVASKAGRPCHKEL